MSQEVLNDIRLYYVLFENNQINMNYLDEKTYNDRICHLVNFEILGNYKWLDLKGSRGKNSSLYILNSSQIKHMDDRLTIISPNSLSYRVSLELIV